MLSRKLSSGSTSRATPAGILLASIFLLAPAAMIAHPRPQAPATSDPGSAAPLAQEESKDGKSDSDEVKKKEETLPLKPARKISFTTDEGTWMSLDVSPDGKQIVFDLLGDLYILPITGGEAKRITSGMPWDCEPRFSPDGKQIAFISDRNGSDNIWLINTDGSNPRVVTKETDEQLGSPAWTPDSNYLVARKWGPYPGPENYLRSMSLWMYHKDGGKGVELVPGKGDTTINTGPAWSPDNKTLYFSSHPDRFGYNVDIGRFQIYTFDRETGETHPITDYYGGGLRPALSPDGRWLVYASRQDAKTGLRVRDLKTREENWLAFPIQRDDQEGFSVNDVLPGYSFTPDSKSVIFTAGGKFQRVDLATRQSVTIPFTAKVEQDLGPRIHTDWKIEDTPLNVHQMRWTNQSPDGKHIVFSAVGKLYMMDLPNGKPHRLTDSALREYEPQYAPDGKSIAYVTWSDTDGGQVWKIAPGDGKPEQLTTTPAYYSHPQWSPDGQRILFIMGSARGWLSDDSGDVKGIHWMPAAGGESHFIVTLPSHGNQWPTWNSDGTRVYYMDRLETEGKPPARPQFLLRSIRMDGVDKKAHLQFDGPSVVAIPSPDDNWVAIQDRYDAYIAPFPRAGIAAMKVELKNGALPVKRVTLEGANYIYWADGGKTLTWSFGNQFYRASRDAIVQAEKPDAWKPEYFKIAMTVPRDNPRGRLFLHNARLVTMKGEEVIEHGDILIEHNRIALMGPTGSFPPTPRTKMIDLTGKTIIPGYVDIHAHLHSNRAEVTDEEWSYAANLAYGVTTTRDPSIESNIVFAQGELVSAGQLVGPRIYSTGTAITTFAASIQSYEDADHIVKRYKESGADSLKEYMQPQRIQRQWLGMAADKEGMNITAEGGGDLKTDLTMVLDGYTGVEHSLPVVPIYKDVIELEAQAGTTYTPTLIVSYGGEFGQFYWRQRMNIHEDEKVRRFTPHEEVDRASRRRPLLLDEEYDFPLIAQGAKDILNRGGHVALGSHGEQQGIGAHWELWMLESGGMTPWQALYSATMNGAESIGLEKEVGSIEPGKLADLQVLNSNPLDDIHNSRDLLYVIKNGVMYDANTLDQLTPVQKKFVPFFWQKSDEDLKSVTH
jgi:Tol biopolymer transport system component/imidazolonepropionase-like amidohydrolase